MQPPVGGSVDDATNAGDGTAQAAGRAMQTSDDDRAARIPAPGARVQGSGGAEDGGARHGSALGAAGRGTRQLAAQVFEGPAYHLKGGGSVWGWVAAEGTQGWLQLAGGRPQRGIGADLREWRVQAAEAGGWERMPREGDSAWFATFRMRVLAALTEGEQGPVYQATQQPEGSAGMDQYGQGGNAESGGREAEQGGLQLRLGKVDCVSMIRKSLTFSMIFTLKR